MAKLGTGEETDTTRTYKNKDQNTLRTFSHFNETATTNDLAFLKKKKNKLILCSEGHIQYSASQNSPII